MLEENPSVSIEELLKRRFIFRSLYIYLFCKQSNPLTTFASLHNKGFVNVLSYTVSGSLQRKNSLSKTDQLFNQNFQPNVNKFASLFESKSPKPHKFREISTAVIHPCLPIICQIEDGELFFVYTKTLAIIQTLTIPKAKKIKQFIFDQNTYKFLVIDGNNVAYIYKHTIDFEKIDLIRVEEKHRCTNGVFLGDSCSVLFCTMTSDLILFDIIWKKITFVCTLEISLEKAKLEFIKELNSILILIKDKGQAILIPAKEFNHRTILNFPQEQIACYALHNVYLLLGYANGVLKVYSLKKNALVFEQSFEEMDGKKIRVEEILVCSNFVVVGLGNGTVSIVMKL